MRQTHVTTSIKSINDFSDSDDDHITTDVYSADDRSGRESSKSPRAKTKKIQGLSIIDENIGYDKLKIIEESEEVSFSVSSAGINTMGEEAAMIPSTSPRNPEEAATFKLL